MALVEGVAGGGVSKKGWGSPHRSCQKSEESPETLGCGWPAVVGSLLVIAFSTVLHNQSSVLICKLLLFAVTIQVLAYKILLCKRLSSCLHFLKICFTFVVILRLCIV